jgi:hypothetical protein
MTKTMASKNMKSIRKLPWAQIYYIIHYRIFNTAHGWNPRKTVKAWKIYVWEWKLITIIDINGTYLHFVLTEPPFEDKTEPPPGIV